MVTRGDILGARKLLEKNRKDIIETLKSISIQYKKDSQIILDTCTSEIAKMKLTADEAPTPEKHEKLVKNTDRMNIAFQEFASAIKSTEEKRYRSSINHYRASKKHAIIILQNLAAPEKKKQIIDRYKIHIVDNRQGIFRKG